MNKLRELRAVKRVTQFRLSLKTGINTSKISFIENDLVVPSPDEVKKISTFFQVCPEEIFPLEDRIR